MHTTDIFNIFLTVHEWGMFVCILYEMAPAITAWLIFTTIWFVSRLLSILITDLGLNIDLTRKMEQVSRQCLFTNTILSSDNALIFTPPSLNKTIVCVINSQAPYKLISETVTGNIVRLNDLRVNDEFLINTYKKCQYNVTVNLLLMFGIV